MAALDLFAQLESLIKERNTIILAHYYQNPDIQDVADCIENNLDLAKKATRIESDIILFCGIPEKYAPGKLASKGFHYIKKMLALR